MKRNIYSLFSRHSLASGRFSKANFVLLVVVFIGIGCYTVLKSSAAIPLGSALPSLLPNSSGSQLFVSPTGSGATCSQVSPCSMQTGINQSSAGTTIEALGGTYDVNIVWSNKSGTAANPITLENYQGQSVTLHAAASTSEMFKINNSSSFIRIKGLKIEATPTLWTGTGRQPFYLSGVTGVHDIDVLDNDFSGYDAGTTTGHDITAFLAGPGATNINIVGNKCHNWGNGANQRQCFYIQADSGLVANNIVYDDPNGFGIQVRADTSAVKTCNMIVTNNTVVNIKGQRGIYVEANCSGTRVRNNVIAFSGAEELYGLFDSDDSVDPPASSNRAFTNLLWDTSGKIQGNTTGHQVLDFTDGSGDYIGPGSNTVEDPQFSDSANDDFQLESTSPAIGQADPAYSLPYDFNGNARDSSPDLGALEYISASPDTTPPFTPTDLTSPSKTTVSVNLSWNAVTDTPGGTVSGLDGYNLYRNANFLTKVTSSTGYIDTGLTPNTTYSYQVSAIDNAGNESAKSAQISVTTSSNPTPPPSPTPTPPPSPTPTPSPSPTPPPASKVGDLNHDGAVNIFDLSILLSKYGSSDSTADINTDHTVNIFDLSILLSKYGG